MTHSSLSPCLINLWQVKCKWNENSTFKRDKGYKKKHLQQLCSNDHGHLVTRAVARETQSKEVVGASLPWAQHAGGASDRWPVEIAGLTKIHTDLIPQSVVYDSVTLLTDKKDRKIEFNNLWSSLQSQQSDHCMKIQCTYKSLTKQAIQFYESWSGKDCTMVINEENVQLSLRFGSNQKSKCAAVYISYDCTLFLFVCLFNCMPTFPTTFLKI